MCANYSNMQRCVHISVNKIVVKTVHIMHHSLSIAACMHKNDVYTRCHTRTHTSCRETLGVDYFSCKLLSSLFVAGLADNTECSSNRRKRRRRTSIKQSTGVTLQTYTVTFTRTAYFTTSSLPHIGAHKQGQEYTTRALAMLSSGPGHSDGGETLTCQDPP